MSILSKDPLTLAVALAPTPADAEIVTVGGTMTSYPVPPSRTSIDLIPPKKISSPDL